VKPLTVLRLGCALTGSYTEPAVRRSHVTKGTTMGLFDFVSKVGAKLGIDYFEEQEKAKKLDSEVERVKQEAALREQVSSELTQKLQGLGLAIDGLSARMRSHGIVHLTGVAKSQEAKEKAVIFTGNHQGVQQVNDDELSVVVPEPPGILHRVAKGDTLSLIAKRYYGIIMAYPHIAAANTQLVQDVDRIEVDWVIRVPPLDTWKYTTKAGDTLGAIAKQMYGDVKLYPKIFEASKDVMTNPDVVTPGMALTIPVLHALPAATNVVA
jgi:nucleoid-associated protein YgaU